MQILRVTVAWSARVELSFAVRHDLGDPGNVIDVRMSEDLLRQVLEQSGYSATPIKAPALLHIACVRTQFDHERTVRVLDEGLALARSLPETDRQIILGEAGFLAASVDPGRAMQNADSLLYKVKATRQVAIRASDWPIQFR
jgi:hypothetical protein